MAETESEFLTEIITTECDLTTVCDKLVTEVTEGKLTVCSLVEGLGPLLVDTDATKRLRGTSTLAGVLSSLSRDFLSAAEVEFITVFFCDRMSDHHSIVPSVLNGLLAIADMTNLNPDAPTRILSAYFAHVHCQTQLQTERNVFYRIFHIFIINNLEALQAMGAEFVHNVISAIDGERDPRNLHLLFNIMPQFLRNFHLGVLTEEAFEVMACYFPVDFSPSSANPLGVTREDLARALVHCLTARPEFAEFAIPLVLDKLTSSLRLAKLDSLDVMIAGCSGEVWTTPALESNLSLLWPALKMELLPGGDSETRTAALSALAALASNLARNAPSQTALGFVNDIIASTQGLLSDVSLSLFTPASMLLVTVARSSQMACTQIAVQILPQLLALQRVLEPSNQLAVLKTIISFVEACYDLNVDIAEISRLVHVWSALPGLFLDTIESKSPELRLQGYTGLSVVAASLQQGHRQQIYSMVPDTTGTANNIQLSEAYIRCLKCLSELHSYEVMKEFILAKLKEKVIIGNGMSESYLVTLCGLATVKHFTAFITEALLDIITSSGPVAATALRTLRQLVVACRRDTSFMDELKHLVPRLVAWWTESIRQPKVPPDSEHNFDNLAVVVLLIVRAVGPSDQMELTHLTRLIVPDSASGDRSQLLDQTAPTHHTQAVLLLEALVGGLHQEVELTASQFPTTQLICLALHSRDTVTSTSAARLIATIVNKYNDADSRFQELVEQLRADICSNVGQTEDTELQLAAAKLHSWVTKGLLLRGHQLTAPWVQKLIELVGHSSVGQEAAEGFRLILSASGYYLDADSHCNVRLLYRQRLFESVSQLAAASKLASDTTKVNYLLAVSHQLQTVSRSVLLSQLNQILPLLVEALNSDGELVVITLQTLASLLSSKEQALEQHLETFVPRFVRLAHQPSNMKIRIAALECLSYFSEYSTIVILPYKSQVLKGLRTCLDDKKRLVRREAVRASSRWFLVGSQVN